MTRTFHSWKAWAVTRLLTIKKKYRENAKVVNDVNVLLSKLQYLKARDLAQFLILLHHASVDAPEFLELVPSEKEIEEWLEGGEEE